MLRDLTTACQIVTRYASLWTSAHARPRLRPGSDCRGRPRDRWLKPFLHFHIPIHIPIKERWDAAVKRDHGFLAPRSSLYTLMMMICGLV